MAEKRMLSKVISISKKVNLSLPDHFSRLLYTWMIPHSDDFGRLTGCPHKVKALVIPMLDETWREVEQALKSLDSAGLIQWYTINGEEYIQIVNFEDHQQGLHKRTKSKFPEPPNNSEKFPEIPLEGKGTELNGTEGKRTEGKGTAPDIKNSISSLLKQCNVQNYTLYSIDVLASYHGVVEYEVIEAAIKKAQDKHVNYAENTLKGWIKDGKTTKESLNPKPSKVINHPKNKPDMPVYKAPSGRLDEEGKAELDRMINELEEGA